MIIRFNSIRLSNFMSFSDEVVQLDNLGYTLVSGKNETLNDSATSNGSGKSSIWEGIVWALTGETIRGNKNVVNLFGNDGALVILDFNVDDKNFIIQRTKDHSKMKSSLTISIDGKDISGKGIRDSESILKQQLPDLTSSLLSSVIILGQGLPQRFSNNTPSGRKQVLEELSKSDFMIDDLKARIIARKNILSSSLTEIQKSILSIQTKRDIYSSQLKECREKLESFESTAELQEELTSLRENYAVIDQQITELEQSITEGKDKAEALRESFYTKQWESSSDAVKINTKYSDKLSPLSIEIARIESEINTTKKELQRLQSITDICPTCGQKLLGVTKPDITPVQENLRQLNETLKQLTEQQTELETNKSRELKENDAVAVKVLSEIQARREEITKQVKVDEQRLKILTSKRDATNKSLLEIEHIISTAETEKRTIQEKIQSLNQDLESLDGKLLYYNNEEENTKNHLSVVNKMETVVKRDFRGCLLKNVIDFIDSQSKKYSRIVFDNNLIEFKQEGNNISISFDNKEYESLSGGEQKKLDIIIQLAIRDMLCHLMNFSSNILVCDEIFDALDITGCQKIIDLVSTQLEDVSSVFIVTHRDNLCIPCDNEITVIKDMNKISHVIQKA